MQSVSTNFKNFATAAIRRPLAKALISWYLSHSALPVGQSDNIYNAFPYYVFEDDSSYVMSLTVDRFFDLPSSVSRCAIDITLDNTTDRFDPDVPVPQFVQAAFGKNTTFASTVSANAITATAGNCLIAFAQADTVIANGITISDNNGNTWTRVQSQAVAGTFDLECWVAKNVKAGATTVTAVDSGGGVDSQIIVEEWKNVSKVVPVDKSTKTSDNTGISTAINTGYLASTTQANDAIIGAAVIAGAVTLTAGAGFTNLLQERTTFSTLGVENKIGVTPGVYNATMTSSAGGSWAAIAVALTADPGSSLGQNVDLGRPVKVSFGFGTEYINLASGVISDFPKLDYKAKTVEIFAFDLLDKICEEIMPSQVTVTAQRTDQILTTVFTLIGIDPSRYSFTPCSNVVTAVLLKGTSLKYIITKLVEAEGGYLWVDETGIIRLVGRGSNPYSDSGLVITDDLIVERGSLITTYIYNSVGVTGSAGISGSYIDDLSVRTRGSFSLNIDNPYIQDNGWAQTLATNIVLSSKDLNSFVTLTIRALPQLQLGDIVTWNGAQYICQRITTNYSRSSGFTQHLQLNELSSFVFFTLDRSQLNGADELSP